MQQVSVCRLPTAVCVCLCGVLTQTMVATAASVRYHVQMADSVIEWLLCRQNLHDQIVAVT